MMHDAHTQGSIVQAEEMLLRAGGNRCAFDCSVATTFWYVYRSIAVSLALARNLSDAMAVGDLASDIHTQRPEEISNLLQALMAMRPPSTTNLPYRLSPGNAYWKYSTITLYLGCASQLCRARIDGIGGRSLRGIHGNDRGA